MQLFQNQQIMPPQRRPLVLIHKCTECATFAFTNNPITEQNAMELENIRLKFTEILRLASSADQKSTNDQPGDIDSAYSSQSSPDDSPISRSDSPSPTVGIDPELKDPEFTSPNRNGAVNLFRSRSVSECGDGNSALKGILKRRPMIRFLSQCDEVPVESQRVSSQQDTRSLSNDDTLSNSAESGEEDEANRDRSRKKTVRFDDRVHEKVFRPNSSILGQRKKNQRKQQRKRKRTNSGDSLTGGSSENENDSESTIDSSHMDTAPRQDCAIQDGTLDMNISGTLETTPDVNGGDQPGMIAGRDVDTTPDRNATDPTPRINDSAQKKCQKKPALLDDKRYIGFVIGAEKKPRPQRRKKRSNQNRSSMDDEDEYADVFAPEITDQMGKGGSKDSGIDVE